MYTYVCCEKRFAAVAAAARETKFKAGVGIRAGSLSRLCYLMPNGISNDCGEKRPAVILGFGCFFQRGGMRGWARESEDWILLLGE